MWFSHFRENCRRIYRKKTKNFVKTWRINKFWLFLQLLQKGKTCQQDEKQRDHFCPNVCYDTGFLEVGQKRRNSAKYRIFAKMEKAYSFQPYLQWTELAVVHSATLLTILGGPSWEHRSYFSYLLFSLHFQFQNFKAIWYDQKSKRDWCGGWCTMNRRFFHGPQMNYPWLLEGAQEWEFFWFQIFPTLFN